MSTNADTPMPTMSDTDKKLAAEERRRERRMVQYYTTRAETELVKAKEKYEASKVICLCGKVYSTMNKSHVKCRQHRDYEWHEAVKRGETPDWELSKRAKVNSSESD